MKKEVALVLSGGGARGIAHIGVIEELESQGFVITSLAGTSMGALVGGMYALGKLEEFKSMLLSYDIHKFLHLVDFTLSREGLMKGDKIMNAMKKEIQDAQIENLRIPFVANATDIVNKQEIVFDKGSFYEAIRASIAIPTIFTPVKTETALLVDGGVMNNLPLQYVKRKANDFLIAVDVNAIEPQDKVLGMNVKAKTEKDKNRLEYIKRQFKNTGLSYEDDGINFHNLIDQTISTMMHQITLLTLHKYKPDMLINISRDICGTFEFCKGEDLIEIGRESARNAIEEWRNSNK